MPGFDSALFARLPLNFWIVESRERVNSPHAIKRDFQLDETSRSSLEKFGRIFQRMAERSLKRPRSLDRHDERSVRPNFGPHPRQFPLRQVWPHVDSVRVKVCVAASELAAPQNAVVAPRDSESFFDCAEESPNVFVELTNLLCARHLADVQGRNVQLRQNTLPMILKPMRQ